MLSDELIASLNTLLFWEVYAAIAIYWVVLYLPIREVFAQRKPEAPSVGFKFEAAQAAFQGIAIGLVSVFLFLITAFEAGGDTSLSVIVGRTTYAPGYMAEFIVGLAAFAVAFVAVPSARVLQPTRTFCVGMVAIAIFMDTETAERTVSIIAFILLGVVLTSWLIELFLIRRFPPIRFFFLGAVAVALLIHQQNAKWIVCGNQMPLNLSPDLPTVLILVVLVAATEVANIIILNRATLTNSNYDREYVRYRIYLTTSILGFIPILFYTTWVRLHIL